MIVSLHYIVFKKGGGYSLVKYPSFWYMSNIKNCILKIPLYNRHQILHPHPKKDTAGTSTGPEWSNQHHCHRPAPNNWPQKTSARLNSNVSLKRTPQNITQNGLRLTPHLRIYLPLPNHCPDPGTRPKPVNILQCNLLPGILNPSGPNQPNPIRIYHPLTINPNRTNPEPAERTCKILNSKE